MMKSKGRKSENDDIVHPMALNQWYLFIFENATDILEFMGLFAYQKKVQTHILREARYHQFQTTVDMC